MQDRPLGRIGGPAKRLGEKGIEIGKKEIEEVPMVEALPRYAEVSEDVAGLALPEGGGEED